MSERELSWDTKVTVLDKYFSLLKREQIEDIHEAQGILFRIIETAETEKEILCVALGV